MLPTMSDSRRGTDPGGLGGPRGDGAVLCQAGIASFASVNVMLGLEEAFDIGFPDSTLTRDVFRSVDAVAPAVESLTD
jgi:hypothetical protein